MADEDPLQHEPFAYTEMRGGLVRISYHGKVVTTLSGRNASRFLSRVVNQQGRELQPLMAKATGNFKRGNERKATEKRQK